jgi:hypothetical protein
MWTINNHACMLILYVRYTNKQQVLFPATCAAAGRRRCLSGLLMLRMKTVGNGRKTSQPFYTFIFEYENSKIGHENERELTEYREFRKRTHLSEIMSNTVDIRKFNTEYRSTMHNN